MDGNNGAELPKPEHPHRDTRLRFLALLGIPSAVLATLVGFGENISKALNVYPAVQSLEGQALATYLSAKSRRDRSALTLMRKVYPGISFCNLDAIPTDLAGGSTNADLFVLFSRIRTNQKCSASGAPTEVMVFRHDGFAEKSIGGPPLDEDDQETYWTVKGPAIFRQIINSNHPDYDVFMLVGGRLSNIGAIGTFTPTGDLQTYFTLKRTDNRVGVMVVNHAGLSYVHFDEKGNGVVEPISGDAIFKQGNGGHLLSNDALDGLSMDGSQRTIETISARPRDSDDPDDKEPDEGDRFKVTILPGDYIYLVGCSANEDMKPDKTHPGAYLPDFNKHPAVECDIGDEDESSTFTVEIASKDG